MKQTCPKRKEVSERLREALERAGWHLFAASLHMPADWQRAEVRRWALKAGAISAQGKLSSENGNIVSDNGLDLAVQNLLLSQENQRLRAENEHLSKMVCSGILGELLNDDETAALADFVKMLRASSRDSDGTATAAVCEDIPVPQDCPARAGTASPNPNRPPKGD